MKSMGLDLSVTATGMVVCQAEDRQPVVVYQRVLSFPKLKGHARYKAIGGEIIDALNEHRPERIVIEGYGFKFKGSAIPIVELGGLVKYVLLQYGYRYCNPSPNELKQFATGKGNAGKEDVMAGVLLNWGYDTDDNNLADGFALSVMGLAHANLIKISALQRQIVGAMKILCN
jgi:crossover junction endodeoxyribonuclease RuvC